MFITIICFLFFNFWRDFWHKMYLQTYSFHSSTDRLMWRCPHRAGKKNRLGISFVHLFKVLLLFERTDEILRMFGYKLYIDATSWSIVGGWGRGEESELSIYCHRSGEECHQEIMKNNKKPFSLIQLFWINIYVMLGQWTWKQASLISWFVVQKFI